MVLKKYHLFNGKYLDVHLIFTQRYWLSIKLQCARIKQNSIKRDIPFAHTH